jgi:hypothetical protein
MGVDGQRHAPAAFLPGKTRYPLCRRLAGWAPGLVWTGAEILAPTGIRSLDRPARSESLYRLPYSSPLVINSICKTRCRSCVLPQKTALLGDAFFGTVWLNKRECEFDDGKCLNREELKGVLMFLRNWKSTRVFKFVLSRRCLTQTTSWCCDAVNCMLVDKYCECRNEISPRYTILLLPYN